MLESLSGKQKVLNKVREWGMNVYVVCITIEVLIYLFFMTIYFLEVSLSQQDQAYDVDLKTIIMSLLMLISCYSIYIAITKDNVYALFQFLLLQSAYNYCIMFKFMDIFNKGNQRFPDQNMLTTIKIMSVICLVLAIICQICFYVFSYSIYKNNLFKVYNRVGAIPQTIANFKKYKCLKNLSVTFAEIYVISNVIYYFYQNTLKCNLLDSIEICIVFITVKLLLRAINHEKKLHIQICIAILTIASIGKIIKLVLFLEHYNWAEQIYSHNNEEKEIYTSTVILCVSVDVINTIVMILTIIAGKYYIDIIGQGFKTIFNPLLCRQEQQLNNQEQLISQQQQNIL